ncbi:hypothetical protein Dimus_029365 [Dionaea muscipula]
MQKELHKARLELAQMKEKREMLKLRLPHQMEYAKKEAIRGFTSSKKFKKMVGSLMGLVLINGFRTGVAQVREMLDDDNELVDELEGIELDPNVEFNADPIPKIVNDEPTVWSGEYDADPMMFMKEWVKK